MFCVLVFVVVILCVCECVCVWRKGGLFGFVVFFVWGGGGLAWFGFGSFVFEFLLVE